MPTILILILVAAYLSVPIFLGYKTAWATTTMRVFTAVLCFFFFAALVGVTMWGVGSLIGKRRTARPEPTSKTPAALPANWGANS